MRGFCYNSRMEHKDGCIFCAIASGEAPAHTIWESDTHMAFLSIFPNTQGFTVVIPKAHHGSYVFGEDDATIDALMRAAKEAAGILDAKLEDVGRTGLMFEGFGVDHLHAKLFPMHGTKSGTWERRSSEQKKYFEKYEGYISSHDYERADDAKLAKLAKRLRE
jgi:histidine triad (HIT) family protein